MTDTISFDTRKYRALKHAYEQAVDKGAESFWFEDHELVTSFAKYMLQFLETKLDIDEE